MKSESPIVPSAHHPALFFTQPGTPAASALLTIVAKSSRPVIPANNIFNTKNPFKQNISKVPMNITSA